MGSPQRWRHPSVIAEYVRTYYEERKRLAADADAKRNRLQRQLNELTGEIDRLVDAIAKGHGDPAVLGLRSMALNEERKGIVAKLEQHYPRPRLLRCIRQYWRATRRSSHVYRRL